MNKNIGYVTILCGALLLLVNFALTSDIATVTVDTEPPLIYLFFPSGTRAEPTPLELPPHYLDMGLWARDETSGLDTITGVWVTITNDDTGEEIGYTYLSNWGHESIDGHIWYKFERHDWKLPYTVTGGTLIRFDMSVYDDAGNGAFVTGYGETGTPDGYFEINGVQVEVDTHLYLNTRSLDFRFTATKMPEEVGGIDVEITEGTNFWTVNMTQATSTEWTGSWTAPYDGDFTVEGYIVPSYDPTQRFRKMTIYFDTGSEPAPPPAELPIWEIISIGVIGAGALIVVTGREKSEEA